MRLRLAPFVLLIFMAFSLSAQEFHFMPKVGLSLANSTNTGMGTRLGLNAGAAAEFMLTPAFALETGVYYSMQGAREKIGGENMELQGSTVRLDLDYVNIPLLAKAYLYKGLHVFAGPQIGFNIKAKGVFSRSGSNSIIRDLKDSFKPIDFSLTLGTGYLFDSGFFFSVNYNVGMLGSMKYRIVFDIEDEETNLDISGKYSSHNNVFQLNAGWRF